MTRKHIGWFFALCAALVFLLPAGDALAGSFNLNLGAGTAGAEGEAGASATARLIQIILLITVLSLAPAILVMVTSFTRIIVVLSFLRNAIGIQQTPPNQVLISLALFLTMFIMMPTFQEAYDKGILPLINEEINEETAIERTALPFHTFMLRHTRDRDIRLFAEMVPGLTLEKPEDTPYRVLIPAFMISELKRAFEIGFLLFIPFVVIDMLVASILMSMGMMMLPPVMISLPFKLIFFVLVDGWAMVAGSLVKSYGG
ncbi:MAG: flagellar type III secretion system pore protein FliP [Alphaproteobacteria bacterium]|nr:flagellar type III secretion system pore protein FliP [Alphaproteobacteria bacterium]